MYERLVNSKWNIKLVVLGNAQIKQYSDREILPTGFGI